MKHLESSYTTHDGKKLFLQAWMPEQPKASLLLVHGLGEHSGRYLPLVEKLTGLGVAVFTFDGRGHGKSVEGRPDAFFESASDYLKDIDVLFGKAKNYVKDLPAFLFGHSMGGGLVAAYVLKYQPEAAGVILSSPAIMEDPETPALLKTVAGFVSKYFPRLKALKLDAKMISRIPAEVQAYLDDPLVYTEPVPARTGQELFLKMKYVQQNAGNFRLPLLILHGRGDRLTNPDGSDLLFQKASSEDKTLEVFEGGYHELIRDLESERYLGLIVDWVRARMP
ncbi:alpha/beta hydrolase [Algoriphagus terrigena]|uniref:alpha/beta hydrolase n=1 Tax=Algoriphagus terrigena TaxID=344884 RepID=UPI0004084246|nr:alpha/beta hydrolase [Algoriphagus terrigena]